MPPLKNLRHEQFVQLYFADPEKNPERAYLGAGFKCKSAKEGSNAAYVGACRMLKDSKIQRRLQEFVQRQVQRMDITADRVMRELGRIAFADVRNVVGADGYIADPHTWSDDAAAAVAGIETYKEFVGKGKDREHIGNTIKLKLWDKNQALANLAKHFKLLGDENPLGGLFAGANIAVNVYLPEKSAHVISNGHAAIPNGHGAQD